MMADPSWWERQKQEHADYMERGGLLGTLFSSLPPQTQASLRPWGEMLNPLEWTPGAAIRDAVQASADTAQAARNLDAWGTLAGIGMMGLGLLGAGMPPARQAGVLARSARAPVQNASKSAITFDPPEMPRRPFEADYPKRANADAAGRLTHDIEGRPLTAERVVGRRMVGGDEVALPQAGLESLAEAVTGQGPASVAPRQIGGDAGRYYEKWDRVTGDRIRQIFLNDELTPQQAPRTLGHEIGHAIDYRIAGHIPTDGIKLELGRIYNDLNGGRWRLAKSAKTGEPVPRRYWTTPESRGYPAREVDGELMVEAIRAYIADPNYLKTVAPKTAARIRDHVNPHPALSRFIQFNSLATPAIPFGMLMPSILDEERQP
ncbi:ImmA/IrrE family metallo-endopeptidase [Vineibacter terrae]|uniref:ImmA/IrrE family metallo-endopeptidase n=1 Tax=Vineibacter terrae TaxID=2586908 RepID=A0A5C8PU19_9HYPH|nr:ImmA/IrrE family metallo-endopeptidase [Vineibacter terrae]TXL80461.1 ImmA/IrrE family metallo-endopeptidase [Vineibacter terrae]